jgi:DNA polymerase-4
MGERPTDALWGIGAKTSRRLAALGIGSVRELAVADRSELAAAFGPTNGPWLQVLARGRNSSPVVGTPYVPRSRSRETTFQQDLADWDEVRREVALLATRVTADVVAEGRPAVRVVVKVRYPSFRTLTHGRTLPEPTSDEAVIRAAALAAVDDVGPGRPVRLLGVRADLAEPVGDR